MQREIICTRLSHYGILENRLTFIQQFYKNFIRYDKTSPDRVKYGTHHNASLQRILKPNYGKFLSVFFVPYLALLVQSSANSSKYLHTQSLPSTV